MKCGFCNQIMDRPLELYDGRWCCPNCKKDIFPDIDTEFVFDALNRELFVRSEEYYYKWLTSVDCDKKSRLKFLDKAVSLCFESAFRYHPKALMRMGYYYDKGYVDFNRSSEERWIVAYFYYKSVCFNVHKGVELPNGQTGYSDEVGEIKLECAKLLANLLKNVPKGISKKSAFDGHTSIDDIRQEVLAKIEDLGGYYDDSVYDEDKKQDYDNADVAFNALRSCFDEDRAPIFGIFKLSCQELGKLFGEQADDFAILPKVSRDTRFKMAEVYDSKEIQGKFYEFKNSDAITGYIKNCPANGVYLCFINSNGGHKYLKKRQINNIYKSLIANNNAYIKMLISAGKYNSCVFYDDDIYRYAERRVSIDKVVEKFIIDICEEDKN